MRRQEKLGQAGRPVSKVIRGMGADGPASGPPSRVLWGPLLSWVFSPRSLDKPRSPFRPPFPSLVNRKDGQAEKGVAAKSALER